MKQIKEELHNIKESLQTIECEISELDKPDIEEGQYWEWCGIGERVFRVQEVYPESKRCLIRYLNEVEKSWYWNGIIGGARLLSHSEAGQAICEEFHNREYTPHNFRDLDDPSQEVTEGFGLQYCRDDALLFANKVVYSKGDWAEIITDEWEIEGMPYLPIKKNDYVIRLLDEEGNERGFERREAEEIRDALNDLEQS